MTVAIATRPATDILPIADYDDLRIIDILPLLSDLSASELARIERYELGHKYRTTLLNRLDSLLRQMHRDDLIPDDVEEYDELAVESSAEDTVVDQVASAEVIDLTTYAAHDPRLWQRLLIPVPSEVPGTERSVEPSKKRWFRSA